jgi:hypothetical protein
MPDWHFDVNTKDDLDLKIRTEILALENVGRADEIYGTVHVAYSDDSVTRASLVSYLEARGIEFEWNKKS